MQTIYTIGHSTRSEEEFFSLLKENDIHILVDIRRFPGSKRYPHFNSDNMQKSCEIRSIRYFHFESLGGRRKPLSDSKNTSWRNDAFRGYADYQDTKEYQAAIKQLLELAAESPTAYM